jgi:hypothetical protein
LENVSQKARLLKPNQIPELIMDGDSDESLCNVVTTEDEEYHENVSLEPHLQSQSKYTACSSAQTPLSPNSASTSEEEEDDDDDQIGPDPQIKRPPKSQGALPLPSAECSTHTFAGGTRGKNDSEAPHINDSVMPLEEFSCCISQRLSSCLLWRLTRYNHWCTDSPDKGLSPQHDVTQAENPVFLAITKQMEHCL